MRAKYLYLFTGFLCRVVLQFFMIYNSLIFLSLSAVFVMPVFSIVSE